jgi:surface polysaccharide O-acyltransferase-like enzyme
MYDFLREFSNLPLQISNVDVSKVTNQMIQTSVPIFLNGIGCLLNGSSYDVSAFATGS